MIYVFTSENNKFKFKVKVLKTEISTEIKVEVIEENIPHFTYPTDMSDTYTCHSITSLRRFLSASHFYISRDIAEIVIDKIAYDMYMNQADTSDQEFIINEASQIA